MNRSGSKYRIFFAAWAISALLLCIGSLIHFHQWKIYHKPLVADIVVSKREQNDFLKVQSSGGKTFFSADATVPDARLVIASSSVRSIRIPGNQPHTPFHCLANSGLRAPPLA